MSVEWDSPEWGKPGQNITVAAWAPDGKHDDETRDQ